MKAAIADGAASVEEIGQRCTAGTDCGACHPELERLLSERARRRDVAEAAHRLLARSQTWRLG